MTDTLSSRMLVNVLGIPAIILLVYLGGFYFALFVTAVTVLALREFYSLSESKGISPQYPVGFAACLILPFYFYHDLEWKFSSVAWYHVLFFLVIITILAEVFRRKEKSTENIAVTLAGIVYVPFLLGTLIGLRQISPHDYSFAMRITMILFVSVWVCDSAAYAFGKKWGKRKILERVSPKKTVAGGVAGLLSAVGFYLIVWQMTFLESNQSGLSLTALDAVFLGLIVGIFGQLGDFAESAIKRDVGVKDSGTFLPGHGGVLDRFDSLSVAAPLSFLYLTLRPS